MKKLLLIQPGAYGDIFLCAPIAKWYSERGYEIHWPVRDKFVSTLQYFDYVKPIILSNESLDPDWLRSDVKKIIPIMGEYDKVLNLADRGPHKTAQRRRENFEMCKYRLAGVPFDQKHTLSFIKNSRKQLALFNKVVSNPEEPYALVHVEDSLGQRAEIPKIKINTVEVKEIYPYQIPDWYTVMIKATEIYCVESAIHQFMDGIVEQLSANKYLLRRPAAQEGTRFTTSRNWKYDYIGTNTKIVG